MHLQNASAQISLTLHSPCRLSFLSQAAGDFLLVAAIDFGTTYSGVAFSARNDYQKDPTDVNALSWVGEELISSKGEIVIFMTF